MVNFLALLGWSPGSDEEFFTRDELVAAFTLEGISGGNAVFNPEKLDWFNQQHLLRLRSTTLARRVQPWLEAAGLWRESYAASDREWLQRVLDLLRPRVRRLGQFVDEGRSFFSDELAFDAAAVKKHLGVRRARAPPRARDALRYGSAVSIAALELILRALAEERGVKAASLIHATRVAVTGRRVSPGLFDVLELLGRARSARACCGRLRSPASKVLHCLRPARVSSHCR